jgi:hypothetical protein
MRVTIYRLSDILYELIRVLANCIGDRMSGKVCPAAMKCSGC